MPDDFIRQQIESARDRRMRAHAMSRVARVCWPGGSADRSEPAALPWVRLWRPASSGAALPVCSCAAGRCAVCN
jgi:hypothetical protein